jgi:hypothetical protein
MSRKGVAGRVVISSTTTTRDARPAAWGQAVECGQDNQQARKVTGSMYTQTTAGPQASGPAWLRLPDEEMTATSHDGILIPP